MKRLIVLSLLFLFSTPIVTPQSKRGRTPTLTLAIAQRALARSVNELSVDNSLFTCRACFSFDDKEENDNFSESAVQEVLTAWARAQNEKDLPSYSSCYAAEFKGLKRTKTGRIYDYDFNGWMRDRWNLIKIAARLNVEVRNLRMTLEGDSAMVEFDQYYHSLNYSDWGPKLMKVKLAPKGVPKIIYEEH